jgi:hypothetical protein
MFESTGEMARPMRPMSFVGKPARSRFQVAPASVDL